MCRLGHFGGRVFGVDGSRLTKIAKFSFLFFLFLVEVDILVLKL